MQAFVELPQIEGGHTAVRGVLGDEWLERRVAAAREAMSRRNDMSPSMIGMTLGKLSHPLVSEVYEAKTGGFGDPIGTPVLDLLELDLRDLGGSVPSDLVDRLRNDDAADSLLSELHFGAGLARLGHELTWLPDEGKKRPEMILNRGTTSAVSIECKRRDGLDGYEQDARQFWEHLQYELRKVLTRSQLNYLVKVTAREFRLGDVKRVVKETIEFARSVESGSVLLIDGRYQIDCVRLAEPGESMPWEFFQLIPRGMFGSQGGRAKRSQVRTPQFAGDHFACGPVTDPFALRLDLVDDPERRVRGVLRNLKNASKQVRLGLPSVVYIDANIRDTKRESDEFDGMVAAVASELEAAHTRVSAVVLANLRPRRSPDRSVKWWMHTAFIQQRRAQHPLPADMTLPGDSMGSRWLPGTWSVVE